VADIIDAAAAEVDAAQVSSQVTFEIRSDPPGAAVTIAGLTGQTPFEVTLDRALGRVEYSLELQGYYPRKDSVDVSQAAVALPIYKLDKKRAPRPNKPSKPTKPANPTNPGSDTDLMRPPGT
ncbi:MAG: PEGA domain-containing protein, partial [Gammaproteobacteria bacterium]|nr:PEGA domain-containing protein [Gammaproteobacteria bacterium]